MNGEHLTLAGVELVSVVRRATARLLLVDGWPLTLALLKQLDSCEYDEADHIGRVSCGHMDFTDFDFIIGRHKSSGQIVKIPADWHYDDDCGFDRSEELREEQRRLDREFDALPLILLVEGER